MENKRYQKLYNESAFFFLFLFILMQCHLLKYAGVWLDLTRRNAWSGPSKLSPYHLANTNHSRTLCLFWRQSSCVWFGSRQVSAIAKVPYGNASCPAPGVLSSTSIPFTPPLFPLARREQWRSEQAPRNMRQRKVLVSLNFSRRLRWVALVLLTPDSSYITHFSLTALSGC